MLQDFLIIWHICTQILNLNLYAILFKRNGRTDIFSLINSLSTGYETLRDAFTFWPITFTILYAFDKVSLYFVFSGCSRISLSSSLHGASIKLSESLHYGFYTSVGSEYTMDKEEYVIFGSHTKFTWYFLASKVICLFYPIWKELFIFHQHSISPNQNKKKLSHTCEVREVLTRFLDFRHLYNLCTTLTKMMFNS